MIYSNNNVPDLTELSNEYSKRNISLMFAPKIVNSKITDELSIVFVVKDKLSVDKLSNEDILPSKVTIGNICYSTDVVEIKNARVLSCNPQCTTWQTTPPGNRNTVRPLKGGLSIGSKNYTSSSPCRLGTLGFIAVDRASQALVGVTSAHVVTKNPFLTMNQDLTKLAQNEKDNYVYQNGETCTPNPALQIGQVVRYVPLYVNQANLVDAALISLNPADVSNTESFKQFGLNYNLPLPFANTGEINFLKTYFIRPRLYTSGRTTGALGDSPCLLDYYSEGGLLIDGYSLQGENTAASFTNLILFNLNGGSCPAVVEGDSGSALIADFSGVRKIIGMVIGGAVINGLQMGIACRIDWIATQLGIEAWDGTTKKFIDPASIEYTFVHGKSYNPQISKNNKTYWQIGLVDSNPGTTTTSTTGIPPSTTTSTTTPAPVGVNTVYVKYGTF